MKYAVLHVLLCTCLLCILIPSLVEAQYVGTGSVSQGVATLTQQNLYTCPKGRNTSLGTIEATDKTTWIVPADVRFLDPTFPRSSDLHNACTGITYSLTSQAVAALRSENIVTVDPLGEVFTCFVFADNYFEMYINGVAVGKDNVPYTQFNSSIIQFCVSRPFTIAIHAVDWEEHLGVGTEASGSPYHAGDGGIVVVLRDPSGTIVSTSSHQWKAQTFYTAPIYDLSCPREEGQLRLTDACSTADVADGTSAYALHWTLPANWMNPDFDDTQWPDAFEFSNQTVGVDNKPAYTNFTDIFDNPNRDASFIWSSNIILDNDVVLRGTVSGTSSVPSSTRSHALHVSCSDSHLYVRSSLHQPFHFTLSNLHGDIHADDHASGETTVSAHPLPDGVYLLHIASLEESNNWLVQVINHSWTALQRD